MTNPNFHAPAEHTADEGSLVGFLTTALIVIAGALFVATSFSLV